MEGRTSSSPSSLGHICTWSLYKMLFVIFMWTWLPGAKGQQNVFRVDQNTIKFIDDQSGLVQYVQELDYFFSVDNGGYANRKYTGKICTALHPDQFYESCYQGKWYYFQILT